MTTDSRPVATGLLGVLAGAFLVGVPWLAFTVFGDDPGGRPLRAPATLGGLMRAQDALGKLAHDSGTDSGRRMIDRTDRADRENAARVSEAYGGAAAVTQSYNDAGLERGLQLIAVRAASPLLVAPYEDVEATGHAVATTELKEIGAVRCLVHNDPTAAGKTPDPDHSFVLSCQRTATGLTVLLRPQGERDPAAMAAVVNEAWDAFAR